MVPETFQRQKGTGLLAALIDANLLPLPEHLHGADAKPGAEMVKDGHVGTARSPRWAVGMAVLLSAHIISCGPLIS